MQIEIDSGSGFCFGVTTAIRKAEEELQKGAPLYCLGDIVHNGEECERLRKMGLISIDHDQYRQLHDVRVLLRAHGEPPEVYEIAERNRIDIIDATCPVVLSIQKRIKANAPGRQIVIFGQRGHAEVLGLMGQTDGKALVIESADELNRIDYSRDVYLYSQTTKSLQEFRDIVDIIRRSMAPGAEFHYFDTICRQVANRLENIRRFAASHDVVLFVCGSKSSNGRVLLEACREVNPRTFHVEGAHQIDGAWLTDDVATVGICGATSTPKWLMEACRQRLLEMKGAGAQ